MTPDLGVNHSNQTTVRVPFIWFSWTQNLFMAKKFLARTPYLSFSSIGLHPTTDPQNVEPINGPPYDENI